MRHELRGELGELRSRLELELRRVEEHQRRLHTELMGHLRSLEALQDLRLAAQREATRTTVEFIMAEMPRVPALDGQREVMEHALRSAVLAPTDVICEFGVWSGATINHIASLTACRVFGFDSFRGLPEDWRTGFHKGHFAADSFPAVADNVKLIVGLFEETVPRFRDGLDARLGLIHIDCDLYSSTKVVLDELASRIGTGCVIVFDEYFNYAGWQDGEFKAFAEFIASTGFRFEYLCYNRIHEQVAVRIL
jgi:hypothetical protein